MRSLRTRAQMPGNSVVRVPGWLASDEIAWGRGAGRGAVDTTRSDAGSWQVTHLKGDLLALSTRSFTKGES
jgi:hypothetical protein